MSTGIVPRIGFGYDVHRLARPGRLVLGGVVISDEIGCIAHSDGDVLLHAICDALLGAAALGDIGAHFPDTDPRYRGISSLVLLGNVHSMLREHSLEPGNIDATVILERPKILPYVPAMRSGIARTLEMDISDVSIKATTAEGLGFIGGGEGIAAHAVCLLIGMV